MPDQRHPTAEERQATAAQCRVMLLSDDPAHFSRGLRPVLLELMSYQRLWFDDAG